MKFAAKIERRWRRAVWIFLARILVTVGTLVSVAAVVVTLWHGDLTGLLYVGFLFMQPMLYRAMTYGL